MPSLARSTEKWGVHKSEKTATTNAGPNRSRRKTKHVYTKNMRREGSGGAHQHGESMVNMSRLYESQAFLPTPRATNLITAINRVTVANTPTQSDQSPFHQIAPPPRSVPQTGSGSNSSSSERPPTSSFQPRQIRFHLPQLN